MKSHYMSLLVDFTAREIKTRYKTSYLGLAWVLLNPLLMLTLYTLVFSGILGVKFTPDSVGGQFEYIVMLFAGLTVFFFFAEVLSSSPTAISRRPNYIKKVVFPQSILVISQVLAAGTTFLINLCLLLIFVLVNQQYIPITVLALPVVILSIFASSLGLAFSLSALGVFIPDLVQIVRPIVRMMFYVTPIAYPLSLVPEAYRHWMWVNPLTWMVESVRNVVVTGTVSLDLAALAAIVVSFLTLLLGVALFRKLKAGFADVI